MMTALIPSLLPLQFEEIYLDRWGKVSAHVRRLLHEARRRLIMLYETVEWYGEAPDGSTRRSARSALEEADALGMEALGTPPSRLELALLRWQVRLFEYILIAAMPSSLEVRRSREGVKAAGKEKGAKDARKTVREMRKSGWTAGEASAALKQRYGHRFSPRTLSGVVSKEYGPRRPRRGATRINR